MLDIGRIINKINKNLIYNKRISTEDDKFHCPSFLSLVSTSIYLSSFFHSLFSLSLIFSHNRLFSFRSKPPLFLVLFSSTRPLLATTRRLWETAQAGRLWPWNSRCTRHSIADLIQLNRGARSNTLARRKLDVIINTALSAWNFARTSGQCDLSSSLSFCIYIYVSSSFTISTSSRSIRDCIGACTWPRFA